MVAGTAKDQKRLRLLVLLVIALGIFAVIATPLKANAASNEQGVTLTTEPSSLRTLSDYHNDDALTITVAGTEFADNIAQAHFILDGDNNFVANGIVYRWLTRVNQHQVILYLNHAPLSKGTLTLHVLPQGLKGDFPDGVSVDIPVVDGNDQGNPNDDKQQSTVVLTPDALSFTVGDGPKTVSIEGGGDGALRVKSSDSNVATAELSGETLTVWPKGEGRCEVIVSRDETDRYKYSEAYVSVNVYRDESQLSISPSVLDMNVSDDPRTVNILGSWDKDLRIECPNPEIVDVKLNGSILTVTPKNGGSTQVVIHRDASDKYSEASVILYVYITSASTHMKLSQTHVTCNLNDGPHIVTVDNLFDGKLSMSSSLPTIVDVKIEGNKVIITPKGNQIGEDYIYLERSSTANCDSDSATIIVTVNDPGQNIYRLYNKWSHEHLYTKDANEKDRLTNLGWNYEGIGWRAPSIGSTPVYRVYNQWSGEHLYTKDRTEYFNLCSKGWEGEGIKFYSAEIDGMAPQPNSVPTYRLFNPWDKDSNAHHYTTDMNERQQLLNKGWKFENICWYGLK